MRHSFAAADSAERLRRNPVLEDARSSRAYSLVRRRGVILPQSAAGCIDDRKELAGGDAAAAATVALFAGSCYFRYIYYSDTSNKKDS
jgi:hypothetical protein